MLAIALGAQSARAEAGKDWYHAQPYGYEARCFHQMVVFRNRLWLFGGQAVLNSKYAESVWSSVDGIHWVLEPQINPPAPKGFTPYIVFQNKLWRIGGGSKNHEILNDIWYTENGTDWIAAPNNAPFNSRLAIQIVVFRNKLWAFGGYDGNSLNDIWSSTNGTDWVLEAEFANFTPRNTGTLLEYKNKLLLIGGYTNGVPTQEVWESSDGIQWTLVASYLEALEKNSSLIVKFGDAIVVHGGYGGPYDKTFITYNGIDWERIYPNNPLPPSYGMSGIEYNGKLIATGGVNISDFPPILSYTQSSSLLTSFAFSSLDGIEWQKLPTHSSIMYANENNAVSFGDYIYLFPKFNGAYSQKSKNGRTWTEEKPLPNSISKRIKYTIGVFENDIYAWDGFEYAYRESICYGFLCNTSTYFTPRIETHIFNDSTWELNNSVYVGTPSTDISTDTKVVVNQYGAWKLTSGKLYHSSNALEWTLISENFPFGVRTGESFLTHNDRLYIIAGRTISSDNMYIYHNDIWSSVDGFSWEIVNNTGGFSPRENHTCVSYMGKLWIIGGYDAAIDSYRNDVWSSVDGTTWKEETASAAFPPGAKFLCVEHNNELFLIDHNNDIWVTGGDETPPESCVVSVPHEQFGGSILGIYEATDNEELAFVELYVRKDNSPWELANATMNNGTFDFQPVDGPGKYYFKTVAYDEAGFQEIDGPPTSSLEPADAVCRYFEKPDTFNRPRAVVLYLHHIDLWAATINRTTNMLNDPWRWARPYYINDHSLGWKTFVGDFDANGQSDIVCITEYGDAWAMNNHNVYGFGINPLEGLENNRRLSWGWVIDEALGWDVLIGDFDGDGDDDLAQYVPGTEQLVIGLAHDDTIDSPNIVSQTMFNTTANQRILVADPDGNGFDDVLQIKPELGEVYLARAMGKGAFDTQNEPLGAIGHIPENAAIFAGDFDGDGDDDLLVLNENDAWVALAQPGPAYDPIAFWGATGFQHNPATNWQAFVLDYDADGLDDLLCTAPLGDIWAARSTGAGFEPPQRLGWAGFVPSPTTPVFGGKF